ncbi:Extragenic suppressor of kinetochore protein 1 [Fusarium oxysporum f. sp. albedinis]|nr:Extragenic suppressor of kinetochore protein 1 [Fusarium oxysporum f. sp. albedinis]
MMIQMDDTVTITAMSPFCILPSCMLKTPVSALYDVCLSCRLCVGFVMLPSQGVIATLCRTQSIPRAVTK